MCTILVLYHSQTGNTEQLANAVAQGVNSIEGCHALLKKAGQATLKDLINCDGVAFGSPENFGYMSGMVKDFFDRTYVDAQGSKEIFKKPYVVFISAGNDGTGALSSIERILLGYQLKKVYDPVIARNGVNEDDLALCLELGQTIAAGCEAGIY